MIEILGQIYGVTVGSDIQRDGMYLEVENAAKAVLAEVF
jgi:Leu/Phe-tRNA-protein transferase